ncbi:MAG: porin family protein [Bacteroidota bacterium]
MKKIVLTALFGLTISFCVAQFSDVRFGMQLSPTFSWMSANTNRINGSGSNLGLKLGMLGEFYFQENYALSTGIGFGFNQGGTLQYEWSGFYWDEPYRELTTDTTALPSGTKLKSSIQFLEIPIGLKMRTREFGYFRYYLEPAITIGIKTQARGTVTGRNVGSDFEDINIGSEINPLNLSWGLGAGVEYSLSETTSLIGGLGFQVGFADVTKDNGVEINPTTGEQSEESSNGKAHNITIKIGILF